MPTGVLCTRPPYGGIRAIDLATGKTLWDRPFGSARRNGPFGMPTFIPLEIGTPNNGGPVVTAGGLIFMAGTLDSAIRAFDVTSGEELWKGALPTSARATPMTFRGPDGKQYLVISAGGHGIREAGPLGDSLVAFTLP
jgi:quinoprotein glucose dehydrogenase